MTHTFNEVWVLFFVTCLSRMLTVVRARRWRHRRHYKISLVIIKCMLDFKIRRAKSGDESGIHEAHMRSIREICVKDHGEIEIKGWGNRPLGNRWIEAIKTGHVWVVESNNKIYGHAYIRLYNDNEENKAHIHGLYLAPEAINHGLGKKLGTLMLHTAKKNGVKLVTLESTLTAHEFYKRLDFCDTGPMSTIDIGGLPVRYFPMAAQI